MIRNGYNVFTDYVLLKTHFNNWRFIWRPGMVHKISVNAFNQRVDRNFFIKLANNKDIDDPTEYLISAFMTDKSYWIGDMINDDQMDNHMNRMIRRRALVRNFRLACEEMQECKEKYSITLPYLLKIGDSNRPRILDSQIICIDENLAILDFFFNFTSQSTNNPLWEETRLKIYKYKYTLNLKESFSKFKPMIDTLLQAH